MWASSTYALVLLICIGFSQSTLALALMDGPSDCSHLAETTLDNINQENDRDQVRLAEYRLSSFSEPLPLPVARVSSPPLYHTSIAPESDLILESYLMLAGESSMRKQLT